MDVSRFYSPSYLAARRSFRDLASAAGARLEQYPVDIEGRENDPLTIDVATIGRSSPRWSVVLSSGLHGVEGFFGSAIQCAWLTRVADGGFSPEDGSVVLIHAINPYGFDSLRRTNEDNADLNRNFLTSPDDYHGAPDGYEALNGFLNPPSPPSTIELFRLIALWNIWRIGLSALKGVIAGGQYEFPKGMFFGGHGPSRSARIIQDGIDRWVADARDIVHIDFHSGLGNYGEYKLLFTQPDDASETEWYRTTFGVEYIEPLTSGGGTAYTASGQMGDWIAWKLKGRRYRFVGAEFGTHPILRVLGALRAENRAHFYCSPGDSRVERTKSELLECFCPADGQWRETVLTRGLGLIDQAIRSH